jgi:hypothetical protein
MLFQSNQQKGSAAGLPGQAHRVPVAFSPGQRSPRRCGPA